MIWIMLMPRVSYLGGEVGRRGFFGGTWPRSRIIGLVIVMPIGAFLVLMLQIPGVLITAGAVVVVWVSTMSTPAGSPLDRFRDRKRWKERLRRGTVDFVPFDQQRWDELCELVEVTSKKERGPIYAELSTMRETPDGVEGMHWLQDERRQPGIAWHTPTGEDAYLSVAWSTSGQIKGMSANNYLDLCAEAFGKLQAQWGSPLRLPSHIQTITRVLPTDTARHEDWVVNELNPDSPIILRRSYDQIMRQLGRGGLVQRHVIVVRWPLTPKFMADASKHGEGLAGWKALMQNQIESATRAIRSARFRDVKVLTARQVGAILRHMQHPDFPFEQAGDLDSPMDCWVPSHDEWSYTETVATPDGSDAPVSWLHRTAVFPIAEVGTHARNSLWLSPLLTSLSTPIVRTLSMQTAIVPAREARLQARMDATTDIADIQKQKEKGELSIDGIDEMLGSAQRRLRDLRGGTHHQGAEWVGHLSISARSRNELIQAVQVVSEAADRAGIAKLEWQDTYQAAAHASTWPVARGMKPPAVSNASRVRGMVMGSGAKEEI